MANQFGRISGPLLKDDLSRNGVDLAFETSQLYLNVTGKYIGINNQGPSQALDVGTVKNDGSATTGNINSPNFIATTVTKLANFTASADTISTYVTNDISITAATVVTPGIGTTGALRFNLNNLVNYTASGDINISPTGTGSINLANVASNVPVTVNGSLHATGDITFDGNIQLGDNPTDTVTFAGELASDIVPSVTNTYSLGSASLYWKNLWANTLTSADALNNANIYTVTNLNVSTLTAGNTIFSANTFKNDTATTRVVVNGIGRVKLSNVLATGTSTTTIKDNLITTPGQLTIGNTGIGYTKFSGTAGLVIPAGSTGNRPTNPEIGLTRLNSDNGGVEIWNGNAWTGVQGISPVLTQAEVLDTGNVWALIFA
jgi:hypothetical protein